MSNANFLALLLNSIKAYQQQGQNRALRQLFEKGGLTRLGWGRGQIVAPRDKERAEATKPLI
jgi:hypothetical protein